MYKKTITISIFVVLILTFITLVPVNAQLNQNMNIKEEMSFLEKTVKVIFLFFLAVIIVAFLTRDRNTSVNSSFSFGWGNNVSNNQQTISSKKKNYNGDKSILFKNNKQNSHSKPKSTVVVNGKKYEVEGSNISIINNKIYSDGKLVNKEEINANSIIIEGNVENIETDLSVSCNNVKGDIKAGGSINCDNVGGNVTAGGSVNCDKVKGNINAKGSVNSF
jgi:hypothetical protein